MIDLDTWKQEQQARQALTAQAQPKRDAQAQALRQEAQRQHTRRQWLAAPLRTIAAIVRLWL